MYHHGAAEYLFLTLFNYILYNTIHIQLHIHGIKRLVKATIKHKSEIYLMSYVILSKVHIHRIYKKNHSTGYRTVIKNHHCNTEMFRNGIKQQSRENVRQQWNCINTE